MGFTTLPIEFQIVIVMGYLVAGLGFLLCLYLFIVALLRPKLAQRACCGQCGYEASATISTCTECGSEYARVGLVTPTLARRLRVKPWVAGVAWTILVVQVVSRGVPYLSVLMPTSEVVSTITLNQTYEPRGSMGYRFDTSRVDSDWRECNIMLDADLEQGLDTQDVAGTASIRFVVHDQSDVAFRARIDMDMDKQTFTAVNADESEIARGTLKELKGEKLAQIAAASGFKFESEPGKRLIADVEKLAAAVSTQPLALTKRESRNSFEDSPTGELTYTSGGWSTGSQTTRASKSAAIVPVMLITLVLVVTGWILVYRRAR